MGVAHIFQSFVDGAYRDAAWSHDGAVSTLKIETFTGTWQLIAIDLNSSNDETPYLLVLVSPEGATFVATAIEGVNEWYDVQLEFPEAEEG